MGLAAMFVGGVSGVGCHIFTNAARKIPLSRQPYLHVFFGFGGAYLGQKWVELELKLLTDINEIRADKGMPPMVGSGNWIKYMSPESQVE